jgi:hypothetical protein
MDVVFEAVILEISCYIAVMVVKDKNGVLALF